MQQLPQSSSTGPGIAGSLKGDNFVMPDGTWQSIPGSWWEVWYYFNAEGNRTRGWFPYGGKWYYFDGNGCMKTGWVDTGNGTWCYLNGWGYRKTGWLYDKNIWYYLNNDGCMAVNCSQDGWYLGADGAGRKE